jgi:hypothetical protein
MPMYAFELALASNKEGPVFAHPDVLCVLTDGPN